ncbi:Hpt domain-containing protein [Lysobacter sp. 13A]|uniref:histidine kinase n=2 Tax=Novilysobacter selenitireducens TaxID=2872639 RepID=A0ABS7T3W6_9GAMM|nr:Hpt domain-containing protein [Lysobacter selenitireducens]
MRDAIDTTTLGWIKPELDQTLRQAREEIEAYAENPGDAERMKVCAGHLHQVCGTLRMVELSAPAMVAEEMERLALSLHHGDAEERRDDACAALMRGVVQLPDYLERLQGGHRDIPIVLLPLLNELRAARGETGLNESVLFSPNLDRPLPQDLPAPVLTSVAPAPTSHLSDFRNALSQWPDGGAPADPGALTSAIDGLLADVALEPLRRMLWVAASVAAALRDGAIEPTGALRQAFGGVERESRQMLEGDDFSGPRSEPAAEPTRQLLYHAANSANPHPALAGLRDAFDLDAQRPSESELEHARGSLSGRNRALLDTVSAAIKEDLLRVKDALDLYLRTGQTDINELRPQVDALGRVGDTLGMMGLSVARGVVLQQRDAMHEIVTGQRAADETALLDVAGALLYVDASLDEQVARLGLPEDAADEDLLASESRKVLDIVVREAIANFGDARQCFVAFVETNWDHAELADVPRLLDEVSGALRILELPRPAEYLVGVRRYAEVELIGRKRVPNGQQLDTMADALASVEYYLEALREQRPNRERILEIARQSLESLGYWPLPGDTQHIPTGALTSGDATPTALQDLPAWDAPTAPARVDTPAETDARDAVEQTPVAAAQAEETSPETADVPASVPVGLSVQYGGFAHSDDIDDEIREVFLEELEEEINHLGELLPPWRAAPDNAELLRPIRRVFHTLKGSGRLVGAKALGEFSWKVENMLNRVLDGTRPATPAVIAVVDHAFDTLPQLHGALQGKAALTADLAGIEAVADRVAAGEEASYQPAVSATPTHAEPIEAPAEEAVASETAEHVDAEETIHAGSELHIDEVPGIPASVDPVLLEILDTEVTGHLSTIQDWLAAAEAAPHPANDRLQRAIHTLNGAFAMTEVPVITEITAPTEAYVKRLLAAGTPATAEGVAGLDAVSTAIRHTLSALQSERPRVPVFNGLAERMAALRDTLPAPRPAGHGMDAESEIDTGDVIEAVDTAHHEPLSSLDLSAFLSDGDSAAAEPVPSEVATGGAPPADDADAEHLAAALRLEEQVLEAERLEAERLEIERAEGEKANDERLESERIEAERIESERLEQERQAAELAEVERIASEQAEIERLEAERIEVERAEAERVEQERAEAERAEAARIEAEQQAAQQAEAERLEAERAEAERVEAERLAAEQAEADRVAAEKAEAERLAEEERLEYERLEAEYAEADRLAREQAEADTAATEEVATGEVVSEEAATDEVLPELIQDAPEDAPKAAEPVQAEPERAPMAAFVPVSIPVEADPDDALDLSELDPELVDIFVEEGSDLLDHSDGLLAQLRQHPTEREPLVGLQRDLHTLKGGARMAGIMAVGELGHVMESLLEAVVDQRRELGQDGIPLLELGFDRLHAMLTRVGDRRAIAMPEALIAEFEARSLGGTTVTTDTAAGAGAGAGADTPAPVRELKPLSAPIGEDVPEDEDDIAIRAPQEQVRIRADLLDRLVNYAGEVAIYRARLEQQLGAFRGAIAEMAATNTRMRDQLRRLEIETEAQIVARYQREGDSGEQAFDPLELDRFSNLQQLSRALSESAADQNSLQLTLDDLTRQYETLLLQQSRVSSDLQEGLMRTRMVPFDSLLPRLRRVIRQASGELGKQVQLKLDGAQGELDRNVLERMTAPLEHMLRNSVAHGLETPEQRKQAGKGEEGAIRIAVRREGSEVVLEVGDDGRGLDRDAIRRRGEERGLIREDAILTDHDLDALILEPGFSTANEVSRLAGRGVGMDVVASEVRQLGGTLDIQSRPGKGVTFTLRLPQTLAVTQAVFVKIGETTFAVPIASVRGVGRIARDELEGDNPVYNYGGEEYAVHDLGRLVGHAQAKAEGHLQMPLLLIRSGDLRAAVSVDQVVGNREIVVKPVGPQVASVPGIFGATIMGDGRVVVILDVAPLVRRQAALPRDQLGLQAPVVEQRKVPLVMVVDDSVTMRKVTGRVLERHNFEVATAKDGVDALERMTDVVPDLMLLDIEMPRMDGYELATHMKADARLRGVPIVMITSRTGDKHRQRAFEIGVERYLGKPYQEPELMRNVFELLGIERRHDG